MCVCVFVCVCVWTDLEEGGGPLEVVGYCEDGG